MSNDDLNISRELHNIYWAARWQTLTVSGTVHLLLMMLWLSSSEWVRESYFRHGRVFVVAPCSPDIEMWVTCRIFVPQNIFTIGCVRGRVSVSGFPRGMWAETAEGPGLQFTEYWRSWDWDQCGNTGTAWSVRARAASVCRSDISSHPSHPFARPGSVLFCMIIIIITRVSHRSASSAGVTGPREPVPKQYQENKSEDQL